ncbi:hypothetical protein J3R08_002508 [Micromonospora sp. HB375]|uniref:hypothetical protein n=1 Tax=unclassified Micromonospora TaxID=2617518 RepID=UPI001AE5FD0B|nr:MULTISPECIES: hypothetical protein [unclassified Micromonospora]MBP1782658.1 hypothetical protein [Micromonospora sp. HB375]MDH6468521.1 hypothetical protein [Micromonospora sp. H404/HB375]
MVSRIADPLGQSPLDAHKITSYVIADYSGLDFDAVFFQLKPILEESQDVMDSIGKPVGMARKICHVICSQQRAELLHSQDQYYYRKSEVAGLLDSVFSGPLDESDIPDDYESLLKGSDAMDMAADIKAAFRQLPLRYRAAIYKQYALGEKPANASYERRIVDKAVTALVDTMNGTPYVPARKPYRKKNS